MKRAATFRLLGNIDGLTPRGVRVVGNILRETAYLRRRYRGRNFQGTQTWAGLMQRYLNARARHAA